MLKQKKSFLEKIFPLAIPLAYLQLMAEKKRFYAASAGIMFAVIMMLFQIGLQSALFTQVVTPHLQMNADIVVLHKNYEYFGVGKGFSQSSLFQTLAFEEVEDITGLYLSTFPFKNPESGRERDMFVIAFNPDKTPFKNPQILENQYKLKQKGICLYDELSRKEYGNISDLFKKDGLVKTEICEKAFNIDGLFQMGATFAADGNVLMSKDSFLSLRSVDPSIINVGLIKIKNPENAPILAKKIQKILPDDVNVLPIKTFIDNEKSYWAQRTPIGFVISASMIVSILVGAVIVYQILYTDVADHLPEYATLKAIGFANSFFIKLIFQESLILSISGFIPGTIITAFLYYMTRKFAYMPTYLNFTNIFVVFILTNVMCLIAGALATRKLRHANPSDIF